MQSKQMKKKSDFLEALQPPAVHPIKAGPRVVEVKGENDTTLQSFCRVVNQR